MTEGGRQCGLRSGVNSTPGFVRLQTPIVRSLLITPYLNITIPSLGPCTLQYPLYLCYITPCQKVESVIINVKSNTSFNMYIVMHCGEIHVEAVNNIICI